MDKECSGMHIEYYGTEYCNIATIMLRSHFMSLDCSPYRCSMLRFDNVVLNEYYYYYY